MKKTLYSFIAVSAVFALVACDESRLDIPQKGVTAIETFYQTDDDAEAALAAAYASFSTNVSGRGAGFRICTRIFGESKEVFERSINSCIAEKSLFDSLLGQRVTQLDLLNLEV